MLTHIHVENFKSLKNITLDLQRVNLLIGPNNSGKSNLLKAIEFFYQRILNLEIDENLYDYYFLKQHDKEIKIKLCIDSYICWLSLSKPNIKTVNIWSSLDPQNHYEPIDLMNSQIKDFLSLNVPDFSPIKDIKLFRTFIPFLRIYKPDPNKFTGVYALSGDQHVEGDCANLVPFLFNLSQNNKKQFKEIEKGLADCVGDLVGIGTPAVQEGEVSKLRLKFFDKDDNTFWADEVSEGVLYFLALLCIVHQPNPPKLLLLEEPERGIHPRRIQEVMNFIFQLAQQKDIQVIMTTHHERVVDYFADIPEAVFIFDKDTEGATQVKNLKYDIIEPLDKQYESDGLPKIKFADSLGEHWAAGFMGGVPQ